jgi:UDP-N-acetylmuramyl tripeptide synthase
MRYLLPMLVGRAVQALARWRGGKGSGFPGVVVNAIAPGLLPRVMNSFPQGLIVVSGTSGKSTTTKMLAAILREHGLAVFTNGSTANLPQGITSAILDQADWFGRVSADIAVLELDEAWGARMANGFTARSVVLTNVMLDDLERFRTADHVAGLLDAIAERATESVVVNADDPFLDGAAARAASRGLAVGRFGVSQTVLDQQPHGLGLVKTAKRRLSGPEGTRVDLIDGLDVALGVAGARARIRIPSRGVHYAADAAAAVETARLTLDERWDLEAAIRALGDLEPVFGRGETVEIHGRVVDFVLVQNTASFQLNVDGLGSDRGPFFLAIGEEEHDPSWLWTVHPHLLGRVDIASGPKAEDIATRLVYSGVEVGEVDRDLLAAFERFLEIPSGTGKRTAMFTASQMRALRREHGFVRAELEGAH